MKILLLAVNSSTFFYSQVVIPFGLASLGSYVAEDGHVIHSIEMNTPPERIQQRYLRIDEDLLADIKTFAPDLVAMTAYSANVHNVLFWAETIKTALPRTAIAVGGNHASYIAREILETCPSVDFVVRFEGELGFKALCDKLANGSTSFDEVPNLTFRKDGAIIENPLAAPIMDLDSLPNMNRGFFHDSDSPNFTHVDAITARGCPFNCTFCNCNHYWGKRHRHFSVPRVIEEIRQLKMRYPGLHTIRFRDEAITINRKHCLELTAALVEKDFGLQYQAHSRLDGLDEEVIANLARAGFNRLYVGLESGSKAMIKRLQKGIHVDRAPEIVRFLRKYNLPVRFSLMAGTPEETLDETMETIDLILSMGLSFDEFYFGWGIQIYPGTRDAETFLEKYPDYRWLQRQDLAHGYVQSLDWAGNPTDLSCFTTHYERQELIDQINKKFRAKLVTYGYSDYSALVREKDATILAIDRVRNNPKLIKAMRYLFMRIDGTGVPWAAYLFGNLSDVIPLDLFTAPEFQHFRGLILPDDEYSGDLKRIREKLKGTRYLVMAMSDAAAKDPKMIMKIQYHWDFRGKMLLLETYLNLSERADLWANSNTKAVFQRIRLDVRWFDMVQRIWREAAKQLLKKLGLFKMVKTIRLKICGY